MPALTLTDRIQGCLLGAAIGTKLGANRLLQPAQYATTTPEAMLDLALEPSPASGTPTETGLLDCGVHAYLDAKGRATPEHFAHRFREHQGIVDGGFAFDGLHTIQELLTEGMHPRLSGHGACWSGLVAAAMPAVGIYHFCRPDYAYLDGVELASVIQPRLGADWAALCAVAVAAAFTPGGSGSDVVDAVLRVAFEHNRDLFYEYTQGYAPPWRRQDEVTFLASWHQQRALPPHSKDTIWVAYNPAWFVLPMVDRYADDPRKLMAMLVAPTDFRRVTPVSASIGGAIAGAMHGPDAFPAAWRQWAEPIARPWFPLGEIVRQRLAKEAEIVTVTERLSAPSAGAPSLRDKVRGCLLAGAIGNAMGSPVEGQSWEEIDRRHPGGIDTVLDPARLEGEDDNQMAMHLVETYLRVNGRPVMARDFGQTWRERLNRLHFYPFCMGHAYERIRAGDDPRIVGHWSVVTGSTVMCMEPVGVYHLGDPEFAAIDATAISYMYQRGLDVTAATILAATVAEAFRPEASVDSICAAALAAAPRTPFRTFDRRPYESCHHYLGVCLDIASRYTDVLAVRQELYERCLFYHMIDPIELLGLALAMFKIADGDVRQSAIGGTNIGRDSDTIAGRAAMLAGILRGAGNVPPEWVAMFGPEGIGRIDRNADRLVALLTGPRTDYLRQRQQAAE